MNLSQKRDVWDSGHTCDVIRPCGAPTLQHLWHKKQQWSNQKLLDEVLTVTNRLWSDITGRGISSLMSSMDFESSKEQQCFHTSYKNTLHKNPYLYLWLVRELCSWVQFCHRKWGGKFTNFQPIDAKIIISRLLLPKVY